LASATENRSRGFTLVELLVVITIIGLLAALLLPTLAGSAIAAKTARCRSNLGQVGIALAVYLGDERAYPLGITTGFRGGMQRALKPLSSGDVFRCPEKARLPGTDDGAGGSLIPNPHYGYNWRGTASIQQLDSGLLLMKGPNLGLGGNSEVIGGVARPLPLRETAVAVPSQMIAVGDGLAPLGLPSAADRTPFEDWVFSVFPHALQVDPAEPASAVDHPGVGHWHKGGANMLFCDGHSEFGRQERWVARTPAARQRWNLDNLSHVETW
jgi:prepilin-type N-terminal cleavage/methylation domain-containing protein/prepilin-type processing-associated H-X9-DG protein